MPLKHARAGLSDDKSDANPRAPTVTKILIGMPRQRSASRFTNIMDYSDDITSRPLMAPGHSASQHNRLGWCAGDSDAADLSRNVQFWFPYRNITWRSISCAGIFGTKSQKQFRNSQQGFCHIRATLHQEGNAVVAVPNVWVGS